MLIPRLLFVVALLGVGPTFGDEPEKKPSSKEEPKWTSLFNGKDLEGWKSTEFGGQGDVEVNDGVIILPAGSEMTGITYKGKVPKNNYELVVEAQRLEGLDFFAATTFPVGDGYASFIPGGWAGGVTGLSSINGLDASENETTKYRPFGDKKWYSFRIRVRDEKVQVFIDDKLQIDVARQDDEGKERKFTTRGEVDLSKPLGIATYSTKGAIRAIKIRELK